MTIDYELKNYFGAVEGELKILIQNLDKNSLLEAADIIIDAQKSKNRIHITGVGKTSYVSGYIAALLSSTGCPTYFLDATESVHGSAGQVISGDVIIAVSNSGQTEELKNTIQALKKLNVKTISVSGGRESWLAKNTDIYLFAGVKEEGDRFNKPPRISILAELVVLQALSIILQEKNNLNMENYYLWHPGGTLGKTLENL